MSSEQMRVELESFVNKGLKEGWLAWPLKSHTPSGKDSVICIQCPHCFVFAKQNGGLCW